MTELALLEKPPTPEETPKQTPPAGAAEQTFLVGELVYLRSFVPGDEKTASRWRRSIFPKSPELVEKWIQ